MPPSTVPEPPGPSFTLEAWIDESMPRVAPGTDFAYLLHGGRR